MSMPSEREMLAKHWKEDPDEINSYQLTGVDLDALAHAAARVISTDEQPTVSKWDQGGFNRVFVLHFKSMNRKLSARAALPMGRSSRVSAVAATMAFAHYCWGIPSPRLLAWDDSYDSGVSVPYTLAEYVDGVAECPSVKHELLGENNVFEEMVRCDTAFWRKLPDHLQRIGDLAFRPSAVDPTSAHSYEIIPLRYEDEAAGSETSPLHAQYSKFTARSVSLEGLWLEQWSHHREFCLTNAGDSSAVDVTWFLHDPEETTVTSETIISVPRSDFLEVAELMRRFIQQVLASLQQHPEIAYSCLVRDDYAIRNVLFDRDTFYVKAFVDWDDVHIMPFASTARLPDEIAYFRCAGLPVDTQWDLDGAFRGLPPYDPGPGAVPIYDVHGFREDACLLDDMALRRRYKDVLARVDNTLADQKLTEIRDDVVRVRELLQRGVCAWWQRRDWLSRRVGPESLII